MKTKILVLLLIVLSSCGYSFDVEDIAKATKHCEKHGGIKEIIAGVAPGDRYVVCADESTIYLHKIAED